MKSLHAILKDLENKTPTKEDYLNLYNRIKYSIESAYPIEKRNSFNEYKLLTKTAWIYREIMKVIEYGK